MANSQPDENILQSNRKLRVGVYDMSFLFYSIEGQVIFRRDSGI